MFNLLWKSIIGVYKDLNNCGVSKLTLIKLIRSSYNLKLKGGDIIDFINELQSIGLIQIDVHGNYFIDSPMSLLLEYNINYIKFLINYKTSIQENLN